MKTLALITSFLTTCICVGWVYSHPGYDSITSVGAAILAFIGSFLIPSNKSIPSQAQKVSSGVAIQAGRDVKINQSGES